MRGAIILVFEIAASTRLCREFPGSAGQSVGYSSSPPIHPFGAAISVLFRCRMVRRRSAEAISRAILVLHRRVLPTLTDLCFMAVKLCFFGKIPRVSSPILPPWRNGKLKQSHPGSRSSVLPPDWDYFFIGTVACAPAAPDFDAAGSEKLPSVLVFSSEKVGDPRQLIF